MFFVFSLIVWIVCHNFFALRKRTHYFLYAIQTPLVFFVIGIMENGDSHRFAIVAFLMLLASAGCFRLLRNMQSMILYLLTIVFFTVLNFFVIPLLP